MKSAHYFNKWLLMSFISALLLVACLTHSPKADTQPYVQLGDSIANATFDTLRKALLQAIATKGMAGAVRFCNVQALPITASLAGDGISIQRVAERFRNPANALDSLDNIQWQHFAQLKTNGDSMSGVVVETETAFLYYKPIMLNPLCSNCHGNKNTDIKPDVWAAIDSLYPQDKAHGFVPGDLRGMWKIAMPKQ